MTKQWEASVDNPWEVYYHSRNLVLEKDQVFAQQPDSLVLSLPIELLKRICALACVVESPIDADICRERRWSEGKQRMVRHIKVSPFLPSAAHVSREMRAHIVNAYLGLNTFRFEISLTVCAPLGDWFFASPHLRPARDYIRRITLAVPMSCRRDARTKPREHDMEVTVFEDGRHGFGVKFGCELDGECACLLDHSVREYVAMEGLAIWRNWALNLGLCIERAVVPSIKMKCPARANSAGRKVCETCGKYVEQSDGERLARTFVEWYLTDERKRRAKCGQS